jgi:hypothetical protein
MGLAVNHFTFWSYLECRHKEPWQNELGKIRQTFALFGYIIHDPEAKDGFGKLLGERFGQLSRMTGKDFLFTAFVNPPESFDNSKDFNPGLYYLADQILNSKNILKSDLSSFYAISISEYLGINTPSLPYIIITDDPTKSSFYFIELNQGNLFEVMSDLTYIASRIKRPNSQKNPVLFAEEPEFDYKSFFDQNVRKSKSLDDLIGSLTYPIFKIKLKQSLAKALLKISFKLQKFAINKIEVNNQLLQNDWEESIGQEIKEIQKIEFQGAQILHDYLKSDEGTLIKSNLLLNKEYLLRELMELKESNFELFKKSVEPDTFSILLDGALLNSLYKEETFFDASPFILPFCKAFEKEMTYSLVHWIRENLEIDLPEYFYKYQPEKRAILQHDQNYFDYNQLKRKTTVWFPPMIGGQIYGLKIISDQKSVHPFENYEQTETFLALGSRILAIRNQASHLGKEGASSLRAIIYKWRELWKGGYLRELSNLKKSYRSID